MFNLSVKLASLLFSLLPPSASPTKSPFLVYEPENLLTKWMIARSYQETEDLDAAYESYQALVSELKENPEFLEQYIHLLRELGRFEEAKEQIQHYLKLVPDDIQMQDLYDYLS